jgi:hypothetical protein
MSVVSPKFSYLLLKYINLILQQLRPRRLVQENWHARWRGEKGGDFQVQVCPAVTLQPRGVVLPGVQPGDTCVLSKGSDTPRQEIKQHHHRRQALLHQELDPLDHGVVGALQIKNPLPMGALAHWGTDQQLQPVVGVDLHNHPVLPPVVPLAGAEEGQCT